ncbi:MAG: JAB domain-containing protein [Bacteroidota bacterium]
MNIKLTPAQKIKVLNSADVYAIMQQVLLREKKIDRDKEHFWLVCLAQNNSILFIELISLGSVNATVVEPMDVFSFALQKRAVKLIMVHNHPSGELQPSASDTELTDKMLAIGKFLKVPVIEHLIISEQNYYSFVDSGLLKRIEKNTTYDLSFTEIDRLLDEMKEVKKKNTLELAKKALQEGSTVEFVSKIFGLTKKQVERLRQ